jgi:RNA polymerase sigma factor (sigma-70 family)
MEYIKVVKKVAKKYANNGNSDDLYQEGVLVCLELLEKDPETSEATLYREVNRRMHDFVTFGSSGVYIPPSDTARAASRGQETIQHTSYSESGLQALRAILEAEWGIYDDEATPSEWKTGEEILSDKERDQALHQAINSVVSDDDKQILLCRFVNGMTQKETSALLGISQQAVNKREKRVLEALKKRICNNL